MFLTFFKSSIRALPILVLVPVLIFILFAFVVDTYLVDEGYIFADNISWFKDEGGEGLVWMQRCMFGAIIANLLLLMVVPPTIGRLNYNKKKVQFYIGFIANLAFMLVAVIIAHTIYLFDGLTLGILLFVSALNFLAPFLIGARLVARSYVRAFWF